MTTGRAALVVFSVLGIIGCELELAPPEDPSWEPPSAAPAPSDPSGLRRFRARGWTRRGGRASPALEARERAGLEASCPDASPEEERAPEELAQAAASCAQARGPRAEAGRLAGSPDLPERGLRRPAAAAPRSAGLRLPARGTSSASSRGSGRRAPPSSGRSAPRTWPARAAAPDRSTRASSWPASGLSSPRGLA